jgi:hypothetical protein
LAVFALSFTLAGVCTGEATPEPDVVVVPVPEDGEGDADENWCCEYKNDAGEKRHALVDGAAECNDEFGGREGRWVSGAECIPCCCKSPNDPDDKKKGFNFELTTPVSCSVVGECLAGDHAKCSDGDDDDKDEARKPKNTPRPAPRNTRPAPGNRIERPGRDKSKGAPRPR